MLSNATVTSERNFEKSPSRALLCLAMLYQHGLGTLRRETRRGGGEVGIVVRKELAVHGERGHRIFCDAEQRVPSANGRQVYSLSGM